MLKIIEDKNLWYIQLVKFLRDGVLPLNLTKLVKKEFKVGASQYYMLGDVLCHRGFNGILLRYLEWIDSEIIISFTHDGICGGNFNGPTIIKWLIHIRYY